MARTKRGSKAQSQEYWSARPGNPTIPGPYSKLLTHRAERRINKKIVRQELNYLD